MCREELRLVSEAFESNYIAPLGPMVDALEKELSGRTRISNAVAVSSRTAALHLALRALRVSPAIERR
jgi:pyridoxal phosphate-dependent aminotransferase EpsN